MSYKSKENLNSKSFFESRDSKYEKQTKMKYPNRLSMNKITKISDRPLSLKNVQSQNLIHRSAGIVNLRSVDNNDMNIVDFQSKSSLKHSDFPTLGLEQPKLVNNPHMKIKNVTPGTNTSQNINGKQKLIISKKTRPNKIMSLSYSRTETQNSSQNVKTYQIYKKPEFISRRTLSDFGQESEKNISDIFGPKVIVNSLMDQKYKTVAERFRPGLDEKTKHKDHRKPKKANDVSNFFCIATGLNKIYSETKFQEKNEKANSILNANLSKGFVKQLNQDSTVTEIQNKQDSIDDDYFENEIEKNNTENVANTQCSDKLKLFRKTLLNIESHIGTKKNYFNLQTLSSVEIEGIVNRNNDYQHNAPVTKSNLNPQKNNQNEDTPYQPTKITSDFIKKERKAFSTKKHRDLAKTFYTEKPLKPHETLATLRKTMNNFSFIAGIDKEKLRNEHSIPQKSWKLYGGTHAILKQSSGHIYDTYYKKMLEDNIEKCTFNNETKVSKKITASNKKLNEITKIADFKKKPELNINTQQFYNLDEEMNGKGYIPKDKRSKLPGFVKARMEDFNDYYELFQKKGWYDINLDFSYDGEQKDWLIERSGRDFWSLPNELADGVVLKGEDGLLKVGSRQSIGKSCFNCEELSPFYEDVNKTRDWLKTVAVSLSSKEKDSLKAKSYSDQKKDIDESCNSKIAKKTQQHMRSNEDILIDNYDKSKEDLQEGNLARVTSADYEKTSMDNSFVEQDQPDQIGIVSKPNSQVKINISGRNAIDDSEMDSMLPVVRRATRNNVFQLSSAFSRKKQNLEALDKLTKNKHVKQDIVNTMLFMVKIKDDTNKGSNSDDSNVMKTLVDSNSKEDVYSKKPARVIDIKFTGAKFYSSHWMTCIEKTLERYHFCDEHDMGYYSLFKNIDDNETIIKNSKKYNKEFIIDETSEEQRNHVTIFQEMWVLKKKVELDIKNDDGRLCNHMTKEELDFCFPLEAPDVPYFSGYNFN